MSKHTIPQQEAMNYPCLADSACEQLRYLFGTMVEITLYLGRQEGFWVSGYELIVHGRLKRLVYRKLSASRKWGEYPTKERAILDTLTCLNTVLYVYRLQPIDNEQAFADSMKRLSDQVLLMKGIQMEIF